MYAAPIMVHTLVMSCEDCNSSFLTVIFTLSLSSVLLPELLDNIQHVISSMDPKMTLKRPPHLRFIVNCLCICPSLKKQVKGRTGASRVCLFSEQMKVLLEGAQCCDYLIWMGMTFGFVLEQWLRF